MRHNSPPSMHKLKLCGNKNKNWGAEKVILNHLRSLGLASPVKVIFWGRREMNILR